MTKVLIVIKTLALIHRGGKTQEGTSPENYVKAPTTFSPLRFSPLGLPLFLNSPFVGVLLKERADCAYLNACIQVAHIGRIVCAGGVLGALIKPP